MKDDQGGKEEISACLIITIIIKTTTTQFSILDFPAQRGPCTL